MKSIIFFLSLLSLVDNSGLFVHGRLNAPVITAGKNNVVKRQTQENINGRDKKFLKKEALKEIEKDGKDPELLRLAGMGKFDLWLSGILDHAKKINKETEKIGTKNILEP
jgi:hypothetical protein